MGIRIGAGVRLGRNVWIGASIPLGHHARRLAGASGSRRLFSDRQEDFSRPRGLSQSRLARLNCFRVRLEFIR
jgi:hypothetical protein